MVLAEGDLRDAMDLLRHHKGIDQAGAEQLARQHLRAVAAAIAAERHASGPERL